jgi:hypothetical protein
MMPSGVCVLDQFHGDGEVAAVGGLLRVLDDLTPRGERDQLGVGRPALLAQVQACLGEALHVVGAAREVHLHAPLVHADDFLDGAGVGAAQDGVREVRDALDAGVDCGVPVMRSSASRRVSHIFAHSAMAGPNRNEVVRNRC